MIFGEFPLAECEGLLLAHSLRLADGIFKKGRRLASADFPALAAAGITQVHGARLEPGDLDENAAAAVVAAGLTGPGIAARAPHAGRCNLYATQRGLVTVDAGVIDRINAIDEAVTVATLPPLSAVRAGAVVATVKVERRPYAVALAGGRAFVTNQYTSTVSVIDLASMKSIKSIPVGDHPEGIAADPAGKYVYVACWFDNVLMRIDSDKLAVEGEAAVGDGPRAFGLFLR